MAVKFAFVGFRHGHIRSLLADVQRRENTEVVAVCEEDEATRLGLVRDHGLEVTHTSYAELLAGVACDVIATGDFYARRGGLEIKALEAGKHVISDKPLCTSLDELDRIETLAHVQGLAVGCQLTMRTNAALLTMREIIRSGAIGEVQTLTFMGQHPRMLGSRAQWYFEPGCHGGSINDIAVHAMDFIGWLSGREIVEIVAARAWNRRTAAFPCFQDGAQVMLRLDNDGGVLGDVSYLAPDKCGYKLPQYWRVTCHGTQGMIETPGPDDTVMLATMEDEEPQYVPLRHDVSGPDYLSDFLAEIRGEPATDGLTTAGVLRAARLALLAQEAADKGFRNVNCASR